MKLAFEGEMTMPTNTTNIPPESEIALHADYAAQDFKALITSEEAKSFGGKTLKSECVGIRVAATLTPEKDNMVAKSEPLRAYARSISQIKLRLSSVFVSWMLNISLYNSLINANSGHKITTRPNTIGPPI